MHAALAGGEVHVDQAWTIVKAVDAIPAAHQDLRPRAIEHLLVAAKDHDAKALKILGRRILDAVAPEVGEAAEAKALADEEAAAARKVSLTLRDRPDGTTAGKFTLPTAGAGEMLRKHLVAIATPKHQAASEGETPHRDERPLHSRLGWAFIEWIVSRPPRPTLVTGWTDRRHHRPAPVPPAPPRDPRRALPDHPPARRQGQLPPADVGRMPSATMDP